MTNNVQQQLRAELDREKRKNKLPRVVVQWVTRWIDNESDAELSGWEIASTGKSGGCYPSAVLCRLRSDPVAGWRAIDQVFIGAKFLLVSIQVWNAAGGASSVALTLDHEGRLIRCAA